MSASSGRTPSTTRSMRRGSDLARTIGAGPIGSAAEYKAALAEIAQLMDFEDNSADGDRLELLSILVEAYEAREHPIEAPDPISAIGFMMAQKGLTRRDLEPAIGSRTRVWEVLNRRRPLTLEMIRALSPLLDLPADVLIRRYEVSRAPPAR